MMKAEKQRKFHETLVKILYPAPALPGCSHHQEEEEEDESPTARATDPNANTSEVGILEDKCLSSSNEEDESSDCSSFEKLTRSQRKKIRRKKLKQAASEPRRREMIGPLLPSTIFEIGSIQESKTADTILKKKNKRRMAKRVKLSSTQTSN